MIGFKLGNRMISCPKYWENFIDAIPMTDTFREVPITIINRELKKYNARHHFDAATAAEYIEFKSEQDYTMFVLRWS